MYVFSFQHKHCTRTVTTLGSITSLVCLTRTLPCNFEIFGSSTLNCTGEALELKAPWDAPKYRFAYKLIAAARSGIRPLVSDEAVSTLGVPEYVELMRACWSQDPLHRPAFPTILRTLQKIRLACCNMQFDAKMDAMLMDDVSADSKTGISDNTEQGSDDKSESSIRMPVSSKIETHIAMTRVANWRAKTCGAKPQTETNLPYQIVAISPRQTNNNVLPRARTFESDTRCAQSGDK